MKKIDANTLIKAIGWSKQGFYVDKMTQQIIEGGDLNTMEIPDEDYKEVMALLDAEQTLDETNKIGNRLKAIIKYKTGGRQTDFAQLLGWKPQYITRLLAGKCFGLSPVISILEAMPEINARWLLLGQGEMLDAGEVTNIRSQATDFAQSIMEMERFVPYMSPDELLYFKTALSAGNKPCFSPDRLSEWRQRANEQQMELEAKFAAANAKSERLCRRKIVKK